MPKTVLLIDDDSDTLTYMGTILQRGGFRTLTAADGQEGMRLLRVEHPDLVLLDIMMPRQSGIFFLQQLRHDEELNKVPVIVVSGVGQMTGVDMKRYLSGQPTGGSAGPDAFLEKPVRPNHLLQVVREVLGE